MLRRNQRHTRMLGCWSHAAAAAAAAKRPPPLRCCRRTQVSSCLLLLLHCVLFADSKGEKDGLIIEHVAHKPATHTRASNISRVYKTYCFVYIIYTRLLYNNYGDRKKERENSTTTQITRIIYYTFFFFLQQYKCQFASDIYYLLSSGGVSIFFLETYIICVCACPPASCPFRLYCSNGQHPWAQMPPTGLRQATDVRLEGAEGQFV